MRHRNGYHSAPFTLEMDRSKTGKARKGRTVRNGLPPFKPYKWTPRERTEAMIAADEAINNAA